MISKKKEATSNVLPLLCSSILSTQQIGKAQVLTFDTSVLVEEKDMKGSKIIRIQQIGNRKEHCLRFEVNLTECTLPADPS